MNKNMIIKYIKNKQLIVELHNYFKKEYTKLNNLDKHLYKEKIKRELKELINQQKIRLVLPLTAEFFLFFGEMQIFSFEKIYSYFYYQFLLNSNEFINIIVDNIFVNFEPEKIFYNIIDSKIQKEILEYLFYKEYVQDMKQKLDLLKLPNNLKNKKISYKNLKKKEVPSLQQLCNEEIKKRNNIICFPYIELDKKLQNIDLKINIEKINSLDFNQSLTNTTKAMITKLY